jgi:hypothetical protein
MQSSHSPASDVYALGVSLNEVCSFECHSDCLCMFVCLPLFTLGLTLNEVCLAMYRQTSPTVQSRACHCPWKIYIFFEISAPPEIFILQQPPPCFLGPLFIK